MADLRRAAEAAGATEVATYIQSGNVVLDHRSRSERRVVEELEAAIEEVAGRHVPVVVRTASQWDALVAANPFPTAEPRQLHVVFLRDAIRAEDLAEVDLEAAAPEELVVAGRELYLHLPNGMGRATLPTEIGRRGPATAIGTTRNWATVTRLQAMLRP